MEYCDEHDCLSVSLSVCLPASTFLELSSTCPILKFLCMFCAMAQSSGLSCFDMVYTFGFRDTVVMSLWCQIVRPIV